MSEPQQEIAFNSRIRPLRADENVTNLLQAASAGNGWPATVSSFGGKFDEATQAYVLTSITLLIRTPGEEIVRAIIVNPKFKAFR